MEIIGKVEGTMFDYNEDFKFLKQASVAALVRILSGYYVYDVFSQVPFLCHY